jgi:hypothetical protein
MKAKISDLLHSECLGFIDKLETIDTQTEASFGYQLTPLLLGFKSVEIILDEIFIEPVLGQTVLLEDVFLLGLELGFYTSEESRPIQVCVILWKHIKALVFSEPEDSTEGVIGAENSQINEELDTGINTADKIYPGSWKDEEN